MLTRLHSHLSQTSDMFVYLLTDGCDSYDKEVFRQKFDSIKHRNHQVTVYDICDTNVEALKYIFENFGLQVATDVEGVRKLIDSLKIVMQQDKILLEEITENASSVASLINNFEKIAQTSSELKEKGKQLALQNDTITDNAEQALRQMVQQEIQNCSAEVKDHMVEIINHLKKLKKNQLQLQFLELERESIDLEIEALKQKMESEENSNKVNQNKYNNYRVKIMGFESELNTKNDEIAKLKRESASQVADFMKLQQKTANLQKRLKESDSAWKKKELN